jgi:hypothetical protein
VACRCLTSSRTLYTYIGEAESGSLNRSQLIPELSSLVKCINPIHGNIYTVSASTKPCYSPCVTVSHDAAQPVSNCPACRSSKTVRIEANGGEQPMLFCGTCGHMWKAEAPPPAKRPRSIFDTDPADS